MSWFDWKRVTSLFGGGKVVAEPPVFGAAADAPLSDVDKARMRGPIVAGVVVILVCVVGLGIWASVAPIWGAVVAPGSVRVESNRQTVKSREGGVVRQILVRDGDQVRQGQLLMQFDDTVAQAQLDVLANQHDTLVIQRARYAAEAANQRTFAVPTELLARRDDPRVVAVIQNETLVFTSRLAAVEGQAAILNQRVEQLNAARGGLQVQVQSIDDQVALIRQELDGYRSLYEQGFAPRTLILRYERQLAEIAGRRGALAADIQRNQQTIGETRLQLAQIYEQRQSEAATGVRDGEARLADVAPRLDAARQALEQTRVVAPSSGYVLGLSQFTIGGVAGAGEALLDVVPSNAPLVVTARIRPSDIDEVSVGMPADVNISAYNTRTVPPLEAEVIFISADVLSDSNTGETFYRTDLRIHPEQLRELPPGSSLTPGMQAQVMIRTGRRTIMSYLLSPIGMIMDQSLREQ